MNNFNETQDVNLDMTVMSLNKTGMINTLQKQKNSDRPDHYNDELALQSEEDEE